MNKAPLLLSLLFVFSFFACTQKSKEKRELIDYITENTTSVWQIEDWSTYDALKQSLYATNMMDESLAISNLLEHLQPTKKGLITKIKKDSTAFFALIVPQDSLLLPTDSTLYSIRKEGDITSYTNKEYSFYTTTHDSIVLISDNKATLSEIHTADKVHRPKLKKLLEVKAHSEVAGLHKNLQPKSLAEWSILDFTQIENGFLATGVLQSNDSLAYWANLANGQKPQPLQLANYTPNHAKSAWAIGYQDAENLQKQVESYTQKQLTAIEFQILEASDEIGCIRLANEKAVTLHSLGKESLMQLIHTELNLEETYRETPIYSIENNSILNTIKLVFCEETSLNWLVVLEDYFVFTESKDAAKEFITAQINKHSLAATEAYKETAKTLSSHASILFYSLDGKLPKAVQKETALHIFGEKEALSTTQFPLLTLQLNADKDFSHINFLAYQNSGQNIPATRVVENLQIKIDHPILKGPIYFSNHQTHQKDILVQDHTNTLHLYHSTTGKKYWSKKLDSPILGEIHEIDLYRNGRRQLAFATENRLHILDRTGTEVAPFPIKFKDKVTQGLAVFDYSNNSDYRFVILQGKEVLMYDKTAKIVRGFGFTKASSNIIMPAQHLRIGNRDYLLFAEENGKLQILDRRGQSRVQVAGKYDIKPQAVEVERSGFVFYTKDLEKINVSTSGSLNRQKLEDSFYKTTKHGVTAFIQAQNLRINQTQIELPFGMYTDPEIYRVGNQTYVSITDTQESSVYVYDSQGKLLQGFPVYGKAVAFLADANRNGKPNLIVQTDEETITQYSVE